MLQLQNLLSVPESFVNLKLELAVTIDVGEQFVKATYFLAGDGPFVFSCYEKLKAVAEACQAPHFSNMRAVVAAIASEDPNQSKGLCRASNPVVFMEVQYGSL